MATSPQTITFSLRITADEYLKNYKGVGVNVKVKSHDGRNLLFPANVLQKFVTHDGIQGHFEMHFDHDNKFTDIKRLQP